MSRCLRPSQPLFVPKSLRSTRQSAPPVAAMAAWTESLEPISIVVAGARTPQGAAMLGLAAEKPEQFHTPIDVRTWIQRDPSEGKAWKVDHWQDSDFLPCQLSLLRNTTFGQCVRHIAFQMLERVADRKVWILYCTAGQHRSDGVAKALASRVFNEPADQQRYFNCSVFSLSCAEPTSIDTTVVAEALKWAQDPWCTRQDEVKWGAGAAVASSVAFGLLKDIDTVGREVHHHAWAKRLDPRQQPPATQVEQGASSTDDAAADPPPKRTRVDADDDLEGKTCCLFCGGTGIAEHLPKIDCVESWSHMLENFGVDDNARLDWCALYSVNQYGKEQALSIVHKVLKKDSGGYGVDKPSAFVVSGVRNAWHGIRDSHRAQRRTR